VIGVPDVEIDVEIEAEVDARPTMLVNVEVSMLYYSITRVLAWQPRFRFSSFWPRAVDDLHLRSEHLNLQHFGSIKPMPSTFRKTVPNDGARTVCDAMDA
jgi:hypothetical protein